MASAEINGLDLYYEIHGDGSPLMLIAGLASDSQSWQPVISDLSDRCRVIVVDNRGVGRTRPQEAALSIQAIADDCAQLIKRLALPSVDLLGHSMGGFIALDLADRYPECVDRLILAGTSWSCSRRNNALFADWAGALTSGMAPATWFRNIFYWIFSARFFEDEASVTEAVRFAVEYPYPQSAAAFENQVRAIAAYDGSESLSRIRAKTLVIAGREDLLFPVGVCSRLAQAIPTASLSVIDGAAHSIHMEQPRAFTRCVLDFLSWG
jgi:pimeloyl-ACP methyl ester carboxylesterase